MVSLGAVCHTHTLKACQSRDVKERGPLIRGFRILDIFLSIQGSIFMRKCAVVVKYFSIAIVLNIVKHNLVW